MVGISTEAVQPGDFVTGAFGTGFPTAIRVVGGSNHTRPAAPIFLADQPNFKSDVWLLSCIALHLLVLNSWFWLHEQNQSPL